MKKITKINVPSENSLMNLLMILLPQMITLTISFFCLSCHNIRESNVIPAPKESHFREEKICIENLTVYYETPELENLYRVLHAEFFTLTGKDLARVRNTKSAFLTIKFNHNLAEEEYEIKIEEKIEISGGSYDAVAMASVTLLQLMQDVKSLCWLKGNIKDAPEYKFRGLLIDLARRKHDIATIKRVVMLCRWYKISYLQLHFTDEHAFTFPSRVYPQLSTEGWAYSVDELSELVAFANDRGVAIIPELEVPGHAGQFVAQMPEVFAFNYPGVHPYTIHMGRERLYPVLDTVIGEIAKIFHTSEYIHIGGDEANFSNMEKDPEIQKHLQQNNLKDMEELYWHFLNRMNALVKKHGKKTIVWEGFSKEGNKVVDKDIIVMAWESLYQLPQDILEAGYTTINVSWQPLYVVNQQKWSTEDIFKWNIYRWENWVPSIPSYHPIQLDPHPGIMGSSMASWDQPAYSELSSLRKRIPAMVEEAWNHTRKGSFENFVQRLNLLDKKLSEYLSPVKLEAEGLTYPEIEDGHKDEQTRFDDKVIISLITKRDYTIRYTLDGSAVTGNSSEYHRTIMIERNTEIRYRAFKNEKTVGMEMLEYFELHPLKVEMKGNFTVPLEDLGKTAHPNIIKFKNRVNIGISAKRDGEIRYTAGDEALSPLSKKYTSPIEINATTVINAGLFKDGNLTGEIWRQHFQKE